MPDFKRYLPARFRGDIPIIPVVRLQGAIMSGSSQLRQNLNLANVAAQLHRAFSDKKAPAVAICINSPGGSAVQARLIYKRIRDLAEEKDKKVIVFLEDVAASGGYMIACAGDEIIADPSSIVGSIGVISAGFGFVGLIDKLGVERRVYTAGENKSVLDPFRPEKGEDIEHLKSLQLEVHKTFIDLVKERRGDKLKDDPDMFTGRFWSGLSGLELGLVDGLGDLRSTLKSRYGEKTRLKLVSAPRNLFGRRTSGASAHLFGAALGEGIATLEDRALWSRYGL